jgi:manganese/zinc/iron transport system substrate-binding protein
VYAVTELVDESFLLEPEEFAGHFDPHLWMDVQGWIKTVEAVAVALAEYDAEGRELYKANAAAYLLELEALHAYAKKSIGSIPKASRVLITAHDAFNYFGRAYDIDVLGIQGISTESEAGLQDIRLLVETIVKRDIKAVFRESSVSDKNIMALVEGAQAQGRDVRIGGELFSDAMGLAGSYEGTYIGMIDHNVTTITRALGGNAPEKGLNGKLSHE